MEIKQKILEELKTLQLEKINNNIYYFKDIDEVIKFDTNNIKLLGKVLEYDFDKIIKYFARKVKDIALKKNKEAIKKIFKELNIEVKSIRKFEKNIKVIDKAGNEYLFGGLKLIRVSFKDINIAEKVMKKFKDLNRK